jgi:hypothetical protein
MGDNRFDALTRRLATGHTRRAVLRGLAGGGVLLAAGAGTTRAKPVGKVTICHKPGTAAEATLTVAASAVDVHLGHGDHLGRCLACSVDGAMECDGTGFVTCANGLWVYRECASGTACRPEGESIICDWPDAGR